jgi:hypothetical protein
LALFDLIFDLNCSFLEGDNAKEKHLRDGSVENEQSPISEPGGEVGIIAN